MANKYKYNYTLEEKIEEEDREVLNDYYRAQTSYYNTLDSINKIVLKTITKMSEEEVKTYLLPLVVRLK